MKIDKISDHLVNITFGSSLANTISIQEDCGWPVIEYNGKKYQPGCDGELNMIKEPELKPCPFCGGKAEYASQISPRFIACTYCGVVLHDENKEIVTQRWNTRA